MTDTATAPTIRVVHWTEIAWEPHYRTPHHEGEEARQTAARKGLIHDRAMDRKSEPRPWMNQLMDQALLRIAMISDGATTRYRAMDEVRHQGPRTSSNQSATTHKPARTHMSGDTQAPVSALADDIRRLETMYSRSRTHTQRLHVIRAAQSIASSMVRIDPEAADRARHEWEQAIVRDTRSTHVIAAAHGISAMTVSRMKKAAGVKATNGAPDTIKARALSLLAAGSSTSDVAAQFDVNPSTVRRWRATVTAVA